MAKNAKSITYCKCIDKRFKVFKPASCSIMVLCIIWGISVAILHINDINIHNSHTNTTCRILNYTAKAVSCANANARYVINHPCYDERYMVAYFISNGSCITTIFETSRSHTTHYHRVA